MILPRFILWAAATGGTVFLGSPTIAQIVPDKSLSNFSVVSGQGNQSVITGGTESGNHLFHSFSQFSIPMNGSAYFNNPLQIQNIFARVTGGIPSSIDGLIRSNGTANVFLLNPSGILMSPNARLAVGGSFTASTAPHIIFADSKTFSAIDPQASPLLTINVPIGIQLGQPISGSPIENQAVLTVPQNLTLQADRLTLSGQLTAGQDLTLQASDGIQIRDRTTQPFLAQSGGSLNLQGKTIDIFALNHPQSKISAQQNLTLRSPNPVMGDAHFSSGGNFRVEQLNGTLGKLVSPNDPVIRSMGDVSFAEYQGASLHVFAGGSVIIPGPIRIEEIDATNGIIETVNLSDGTELSINGKREPTLDIRAGMRPDAIGIPTTTTQNPILADIRTGTISFAETPAPRAGTVLLTNQFEPNLALSGGDIRVERIFGGGAFVNGATIAIDARGTVKSDDLFLASSVFVEGGNVRILARKNVEVPFISTSSSQNSGGMVTIAAGGNINLERGILSNSSASDPWDGGAVELTANGNISSGRIRTSSAFGNAGVVNITSLTGDVDLSRGDIYALSGSLGKTKNRVAINAQGDISTRWIDTSASDGNESGGGAITVTSQDGNISINKGVLVSTSYGKGNSGNIRLNAGQNIIGDDSELYSGTTNTTIGNAGNIEVVAGNLITWKRQQDGILTYPGFFAFSRGQGNAGDVTIAANVLSLLGSSIETGLSFKAIGESGNINIKVRDALVMDGGEDWFAPITTQAKPNGFMVSALGSKGNITIQAGSLTMRNRAEISTGMGDNLDRANQVPNRSILAKGNAGNIDLAIQGETSMTLSSISSRIFSNAIGNAGQITINTGSMSTYQAEITSSTAGIGNANTIAITADRSLNFADSGISATVDSSGIGHGKQVTLKAPSIAFTDGAQINTLTVGQGDAGNVNVIGDQVTLEGINLLRSPFTLLTQLLVPPYSSISTTAPDFTDGIRSGIFSSTLTGGKGGNITIDARSVAVSQGAAIEATTNQIDPTNPKIGPGGTIQINADRLNLWAGGQLSVATTAAGAAGAIRVKANQVEILGSDPTFAPRLAEYGMENDIYGRPRADGQPVSGIFASTSPTSTGVGGKISILAPSLSISDQAEISVNSQGTGNGGQIRLMSDRVALDRGNLVAKTASGEGGNLFLTIQNLLTLRNNSQISATANGIGNGGNIEINVPNGFIIARPNENSDITANANQGRGGNINITAQSIFGIVPRSRSTGQSDITASSDVGINGSIRLTTLEPEPKPNLQALPQLIDSTNQIAQTCSAKTRSNTFVVTGKGGLPPDPNGALNATQPWQSTDSRQAAVKLNPKSPIDAQSAPLLEATHWIKDADGRVKLLAGIPVQSPSMTTTNNCATIDRNRIKWGESL